MRWFHLLVVQVKTGMRGEEMHPDVLQELWRHRERQAQQTH